MSFALAWVEPIGRKSADFSVAVFAMPIALTPFRWFCTKKRSDMTMRSILTCAAANQGNIARTVSNTMCELFGLNADFDLPPRPYFRSQQLNPMRHDLS